MSNTEIDAALRAVIDELKSVAPQVKDAVHAFETKLAGHAHKASAAYDISRRMLESVTEEVQRVSADAKKLNEINKATAKLLAG